MLLRSFGTRKQDQKKISNIFLVIISKIFSWGTNIEERRKKLLKRFCWKVIRNICTSILRVALQSRAALYCACVCSENSSTVCVCVQVVCSFRPLSLTQPTAPSTTANGSGTGYSCCPALSSPLTPPLPSHFHSSIIRSPGFSLHWSSSTLCVSHSMMCVFLFWLSCSKKSGIPTIWITNLPSGTFQFNTDYHHQKILSVPLNKLSVVGVCQKCFFSFGTTNTAPIAIRFLRIRKNRYEWAFHKQWNIIEFTTSNWPSLANTRNRGCCLITSAQNKSSACCLREDGRHKSQPQTSPRHCRGREREEIVLREGERELENNKITLET